MILTIKTTLQPSPIFKRTPIANHLVPIPPFNVTQLTTHQVFINFDTTQFAPAVSIMPGIIPSTQNGVITSNAFYGWNCQLAYLSLNSSQGNISVLGPITISAPAPSGPVPEGSTISFPTPTIYYTDGKNVATTNSPVIAFLMTHPDNNLSRNQPTMPPTSIAYLSLNDEIFIDYDDVNIFYNSIGTLVWPGVSSVYPPAMIGSYGVWYLVWTDGQNELKWMNALNGTDPAWSAPATIPVKPGSTNVAESITAPALSWNLAGYYTQQPGGQQVLSEIYMAYADTSSLIWWTKSVEKTPNLAAGNWLTSQKMASPIPNMPGGGLNFGTNIGPAIFAYTNPNTQVTHVTVVWSPLGGSNELCMSTMVNDNNIWSWPTVLYDQNDNIITSLDRPVLTPDPYYPGQALLFYTDMNGNINYTNLQLPS